MGLTPAIEETYTIEPPPLEIRCGATSFVNKNALLTLTSNILSQISSSH